MMNICFFLKFNQSERRNSFHDLDQESRDTLRSYVTNKFKSTYISNTILQAPLELIKTTIFPIKHQLKFHKFQELISSKCLKALLYPLHKRCPRTDPQRFNSLTRQVCIIGSRRPARWSIVRFNVISWQVHCLCHGECHVVFGHVF